MAINKENSAYSTIKGRREKANVSNIYRLNLNIDIWMTATEALHQ